MKEQLIIACLITVFILAAGTGSAADVRPLIEHRGNGKIDWTKGTVAARGVVDQSTYSYLSKNQGQRQQTIAEAMVKARHNLLETVVGIRINAENRVIDIAENYPSIMAQLRQMTNQAPEVENLRRYRYDGSVEVWSQMKLNGGFSQLILPPEITQIESLKQVRPGKNSQNLRSNLAFQILVV